MFCKILLLSSLLCVVAGCGGYGIAASPTVSSGVNGHATFTVKWPSRARLIPVASNLLEVSLSQNGKIVSTQKLTRPAGDQPTSTATFSDLPYGDLAVDIKAYPNADGSGVVQATGAGTMSVSEDKPGAVTLALEPTVDTLTIGGVPSAFANSDVMTVTLQAKNKNGDTVLLANGGASEPVKWSVDNGSVATIVGTGSVAKLTGGNAGTTTLHASLKVSDGGAFKEATTSLKSVTRTLAMSQPKSGWTYGWIPIGNVLSATVDPPFTSDVVVPLSPKGPLSFSFGLSFKANSGSGGTRAALQHIDQDTAATVTATYGSLSVTQNLIIHANPVAAITGPATLTSGASGKGTVRLGTLALTAEDVNLSCDDPEVVLPAKVTISAPTYDGGGGIEGAPTLTPHNSVDFTFTAPKVTAEKTITITASRHDSSQKCTVKITPN